MTETLKGAIIGAVVGTVLTSALSIPITLYVSHTQDAQKKSEKQTEAQRARMLDFTQSLETILYDLNNNKFDEFEANANKFEERMSRSEFSAFLETRDTDNFAQPFSNQVSVLRSELKTYRDARRQYAAYIARCQAQDLKPEVAKRLLLEVPVPWPLIAVWPLDAMTRQLRTEMAMDKAIRK